MFVSVSAERRIPAASLQVIAVDAIQSVVWQEVAMCGPSALKAPPSFARELAAYPEPRIVNLTDPLEGPFASLTLLTATLSMIGPESATARPTS
jgi:hypothetical protein